MTDGAEAEPTVRAVNADAAEDASGVLWRLEESGRQLDSNLVRLAPGGEVRWHAENDLDVLLVAVAGEGTAETGDGSVALAAGTVLWLPRGTRRRLTAGAVGLTYVTAHQRRPGMWIQRRTP